MNILLINNNPVVSRLLALCTRGGHIGLDEVKHVEDMKDVKYDILFVDDASYADDMDVLLDDRSIRKKVFISYNEEKMKGFDKTIKKPFLPSQIMNVIESVNSSEDVEEHEEDDLFLTPSVKEEEAVKKEVLPDIFPLPIEDEETDEILEPEEKAGTEILNSNEIEKIKALLDMDDEIEVNDETPLSEDEYEARKVQVIKEQLIADGLEIVEELCVVVDDISEKTEKSKKKNKKKKETPFSPKELAKIEEAMETAISKLKPKKIKKLLKGKKIEIKIKLEDDQ